MPEIKKDTAEPTVEVKKSRDGVWFKTDFSASALLFWIKGSVAVDYRFVKVVEQNTVLGILPAGTHKENIPLKNISSASIDTSYKIKRFILGIIFFLIGLAMFGSSALWGLIMVLIGVVIFLNGIFTSLSIEKAGSDYVINVPFFDKQKMLKAQSVIEQALSTDSDKTDNSLYNHRLADENMDDVK